MLEEHQPHVVMELWRPYTESTRASHAGAEYRCGCGATTKYPGECGWRWRLIHPVLGGRGRRTEAICDECYARKPPG